MSGSSSKPPRAIRIAILAMGGEGGGVLADWIVSIGEANGHIAQLTSVPGVAQRTGATNYYIELFPAPEGSSGKSPVLALTPFPGDVDIVMASELMEAGRAIQRGLVTPEQTTLITSTSRVYAMTERTSLGDGRVDEGKILEACRLASQRLVAIDLAQIAATSGSVISASMLGALAGARVLPFERGAFEDAITRGGVGVASSLKAFAAAHDEASMRSLAKTPSPSATPTEFPSHTDELPAAARDLIASASRSLPAAVREIACEAIARLADYQDTAYARLFLERLAPIVDLDSRHGDGTHRLAIEAARWLALAMSYEDTIRVAELKIRAARFDRVRKEVRAGDAQILEISEFLHPRLQEIAESVPAPLGRFLQRSGLARRVIERLTRSGKVVATTSIRGLLLMSAVASLKPRRRSSLRYVAEQKAIEAWLAEVARFAALDYEMAVEIAELRRLVKGYGDTHARGSASYAAILEAARGMKPGADAAAHIAMLRRAALDEESGEKLKALLGVMGR